MQLGMGREISDREFLGETRRETLSRIVSMRIRLSTQSLDLSRFVSSILDLVSSRQKPVSTHPYMQHEGIAKANFVEMIVIIFWYVYWINFHAMDYDKIAEKVTSIF